jgi:hypothetical protein
MPKRLLSDALLESILVAKASDAHIVAIRIELKNQ